MRAIRQCTQSTTAPPRTCGATCPMLAWGAGQHHPLTLITSIRYFRNGSTIPGRRRRVWARCPTLRATAARRRHFAQARAGAPATGILPPAPEHRLRRLPPQDPVLPSSCAHKTIRPAPDCATAAPPRRRPAWPSSCPPRRHRTPTAPRTGGRTDGLTLPERMSPGQPIAPHSPPANRPPERAAQHTDDPLTRFHASAATAGQSFGFRRVRTGRAAGDASQALAPTEPRPFGSNQASGRLRLPRLRHSGPEGVDLRDGSARPGRAIARSSGSPTTRALRCAPSHRALSCDKAFW